MTQRIANTVVWHELRFPSSVDLGKVQNFYKNTLGLAPVTLDVSFNFLAAHNQFHATIAQQGTRAHWLPSMMVSDLKASSELGVKSGGKLLEGATKIPRATICVQQDPIGGVFAMVEFDKETKESKEGGEGKTQDQIQACAKLQETASSAFQKWFGHEYHCAASDKPKLVDFYTKVFGWEAKTDQGFTIFGLAGSKKPLVCVCECSSENDPVGWHSVAKVDDLDAVVANFVKHGGKVIKAAADLPFGNVGRTAIVQDCAGASLSLLRATPGGPCDT